jgi:hypothetical protein
VQGQWLIGGQIPFLFHLGVVVKHEEMLVVMLPKNLCKAETGVTASWRGLVVDPQYRQMEMTLQIVRISSDNLDIWIGCKGW